jgi:hypothetical protein
LRGQFGVVRRVFVALNHLVCSSVREKDRKLKSEAGRKIVKRRKEEKKKRRKEAYMIAVPIVNSRSLISLELENEYAEKLQKGKLNLKNRNRKTKR